MVRKTGKQLRLGALFRQIIQTWRENQAPCEHPWKGNLGHASKSRLKSTKNLCLSHRFFCKIRQIHRFFDAFRQKLQILCRNQARTGRLGCRHTVRTATLQPPLAHRAALQFSESQRPSWWTSRSRGNRKLRQ